MWGGGARPPPPPPPPRPPARRRGGLPAGGRGRPPRSRGTAPPNRCQSDYLSQADTPLPLFCYAFGPRRGSMSYSSNMLRRTFLQTLPAAAAAMTAAAAEEVPVKLGFDT